MTNIQKDDYLCQDMKRTVLAILALLCVFVTSCYKDDPPYEGEYSDVFIYYGLGYNNLSGNLRTNLMDLCKGILPGKSREKAIIAFSHNTATYGDYSTKNPPVLMRIHRAEGIATIDTLKIYDDMTVSASPASMNRVLSDIKDMFPSKNYGFLISSHGTGWIPQNYSTSSTAASLCSADGKPYPLTKAIGSQYQGSYRNNLDMDIKEFADAFPMKMDYIIFDACLMGGIEVAWELKDVCDRIVFSPAEILSHGMIYETLSWNFLSGEDADLESFCKEYYEYYSTQSGQLQAGTISLVDCGKLDRLGAVYTEILAAHRDGLSKIDKSRVQKYFYDNKNWYYDFRDIAVEIGADESELSRLDEALEECVVYHAETEYFFDLKLKDCCGLSMYLEDARRPQLNSYYKTLAWNEFSGLVE